MTTAFELLNRLAQAACSMKGQLTLSETGWAEDGSHFDLVEWLEENSGLGVGIRCTPDVDVYQRGLASAAIMMDVERFMGAGDEAIAKLEEDQ